MLASSNICSRNPSSTCTTSTSALCICDTIYNCKVNGIGFCREHESWWGSWSHHHKKYIQYCLTTSTFCPTQISQNIELGNRAANIQTTLYCIAILTKNNLNNGAKHPRNLADKLRLAASSLARLLMLHCNFGTLENGQTSCECRIMEASVGCKKRASSVLSKAQASYRPATTQNYISRSYSLLGCFGLIGMNWKLPLFSL